MRVHVRHGLDLSQQDESAGDVDAIRLRRGKHREQWDLHILDVVTVFEQSMIHQELAQHQVKNSQLLCSAAASPSTSTLMSPANVSPKDCMTLLAKFMDPSIEEFAKVRVVKLLSYMLCCLCLAL